MFDEIEKAHPDVFDIFLQIFDEGRLTDSHGRKVNFSEAVIIITSNLGRNHGSASRHAIGFAASEAENGAEYSADELRDYEDSIMKAVNSAIRPEILNRIQKKVIFYPLGRLTILGILNKILGKLNLNLEVKQMCVKMDDAARDLLVERGYSKAFGAREMQRVFDIYVTEPLSRMILEREVTNGMTVNAMGTKDGSILLHT